MWSFKTKGNTPTPKQWNAGRTTITYITDSYSYSSYVVGNSTHSSETLVQRILENKCNNYVITDSSNKIVQVVPAHLVKEIKISTEPFMVNL